jgi:hypothetical protein
METSYFRINKKEYCHITNDTIFIINSKIVTRVPLENELSEAWGIVSILNYLLFAFLFVYTAVSLTHYGINYFSQPLNYGALFLLFLSFVRMKNGFLNSSTPTIMRSRIRAVYLKTPKFSFPRLEIYFNSPEGKVLKKTIPIYNKKEAFPVLKEKRVL